MTFSGGKAARRRAKNAIAAQTGNLYKAQFGKAKKWDALPEPPTSKQMQPHVPRATQKMRALMAISKGEKPAVKSRPSGGKDGKRSKKQAAEQATTGGASTSGREAATEGEPEGKPTPVGLDVTGNVGVGGSNPFLGVAANKTKLKRKAHLDEKKKLKRLRAQVAKAGGNAKVEEDDGFEEDHVEFGETSAAPPQVTLKRRHWDTEQTAEAHKRRNADAMRKHLQAAEDKLTKASGARSSVKRKTQVQHEEQLRAQHVEAYRNRNRTTAPSATLQTMKALIT